MRCRKETPPSPLCNFSPQLTSKGPGCSGILEPQAAKLQVCTWEPDPLQAAYVFCKLPMADPSPPPSDPFRQQAGEERIFSANNKILPTHSFSCTHTGIKILLAGK